MQKITPFLWYDGKAEEAANFYTSIFKNSKVLNVARYGDAGPGPKGSVMLVTFELDGQRFMALNGGPEYTFLRPYRSLSTAKRRPKWMSCGETLGRRIRGAMRMAERQFGVSWQIIPRALMELMGTKTRQNSESL